MSYWSDRRQEEEDTKGFLKTLISKQGSDEIDKQLDELEEQVLGKQHFKKYCSLCKKITKFLRFFYPQENKGMCIECRCFISSMGGNDK